jgi:hypothetical protein
MQECSDRAISYNMDPGNEGRKHLRNQLGKSDASVDRPHISYGEVSLQLMGKASFHCFSVSSVSVCGLPRSALLNRFSGTYICRVWFAKLLQVIAPEHASLIWLLNVNTVADNLRISGVICQHRNMRSVGKLITFWKEVFMWQAADHIFLRARKTHAIFFIQGGDTICKIMPLSPMMRGREPPDSWKKTKDYSHN